MGNENERKRDPADNRERERGHEFDEVKSGGGESNVGQTGDVGGAARGQGVGSGGSIGGSSEFLSGMSDTEQPAGQSGNEDREIGSDAKQVLTGEQQGTDTFSGQPQSGTSTIAANNSRDDLGASGAGSPGGQSSGQSSGSLDEPQVGPGGQSEIGGASDLGGGETGQGDGGGFIGSPGSDSGDYLQNDGNPQAGFAEQGRGAPDGTEPGGVEGIGERTDNRGSDIEGSSSSGDR